MKRDKKDNVNTHNITEHNMHRSVLGVCGDCTISLQHYVHAILLILEPFMTRDIGRSSTGNRTPMLCKRSRYAEW